MLLNHFWFFFPGQFLGLQIKEEEENLEVDESM
jgi:hypothetical protein